MAFTLRFYKTNNCIDAIDSAGTSEIGRYSFIARWHNGFGLVTQNQKFQIHFSFESFCHFARPIQQVSLNLQAVDIDLGQATYFIDSLKKEMIAKEHDFADVWQSAAKMCQELGMDVPLRPTRECRQFRLANFDNSSSEASGFRTTLNNGDEFANNLYLPLVHCLSAELNARFNDDSLRQLDIISICFPTSSQFLKFEKLKVVCDKFELDAELMKDSELGMARHILSQNHAKTPLTSLCELLSLLPPSYFPVLHSVLRILATLPVTTANNERSFSTMRRIKTHLRATMTDERLNRLALISTEKDIACSLPLDALVKLFFQLQVRERK
jgi:hypothetical protein